MIKEIIVRQIKKLRGRGSGKQKHEKWKLRWGKIESKCKWEMRKVIEKRKRTWGQFSVKTAKEGETWGYNKKKRGRGDKSNKWKEGNKGAEVQGQDKWLKHDPERRDACTHFTFRSNGSIPMIRGFGMGGRKYSFILKVNVDREEVWTCQYANKNNTFILPRCNSVTLRRDKTYRRSLILSTLRSEANLYFSQCVSVEPLKSSHGKYYSEPLSALNRNCWCVLWGNADVINYREEKLKHMPK